MYLYAWSIYTRRANGVEIFYGTLLRHSILRLRGMWPSMQSRTDSAISRVDCYNECCLYISAQCWMPAGSGATHRSKTPAVIRSRGITIVKSLASWPLHPAAAVMKTPAVLYTGRRQASFVAFRYTSSEKRLSDDSYSAFDLSG